MFRTWLKFGDHAPVERLPEFVTNCNNKIVVQFSLTQYDDNSAYIDGYYYMPYKFGFNLKNFLFMLRKFSSIFISTIRQNDKDDIFFNPRSVDEASEDI